MLKCHELLGFMSPGLSQEILETSFSSDKAMYRAVLSSVAEAKHVRAAFLEKKPRAERHKDFLSVLSRPRMEEASANLLRGWLVKTQTALLGDFLDHLAIPHKSGVVEEFPEKVDDAKLASAIELLLSKHPAEKVIIYLNTILTTSVPEWENLVKILDTDPRLQIA